MRHTRIKIEGLRDADTAALVAQMGADAIGLVFADSPRRVTAEQAAEIVRAVPPFVATVGVFVNADAAAINRVVEQTGISYVQLHGDETPEIVAQLTRPSIKAFRVRDEGWLAEVQAWLEAVPDRTNLSGVLLDAYAAGARGGTGERFNWDFVAKARVAGGLEGLPPIVLAGGLDADCVRRAIELVQPWAVDVASGVESAPGVKDMCEVERFIQAVKNEG